MNDDLQIIDIPEALNRSMGDVEFLKMMLEELHRTVPDYVARLRDAMQNNDLETLGSDAHQFKGAAANLGAKAIADVAYQLEKIGKSGAIAGVDETFGALEKAIAAFNQYFEKIDWETVAPE